MRIVSFELHNYITKYIGIMRVEEKIYSKSPAPSIKKAKTHHRK